MFCKTARVLSLRHQKQGFLIVVYFYIHPSLGSQITFLLYSCTFSFKFGDVFYILNIKFWQKKDYGPSSNENRDFHFEMVQFNP